MNCKSTLLMAFVGILFMSALSAQANYPTGYLDACGRKLGRGISNIVFSPTEIFNSVYTVQKHDGEVAAATYGVIQGVGRTIGRIGVGAFEIVTFPMATTPVLKPEFPARKGVISTILEPRRTHNFPESDDWHFVKFGPYRK